MAEQLESLLEMIAKSIENQCSKWTDWALKTNDTDFHYFQNVTFDRVKKLRTE